METACGVCRSGQWQHLAAGTLNPEEACVDSMQGLQIRPVAAPGSAGSPGGAQRGRPHHTSKRRARRGRSNAVSAQDEGDSAALMGHAGSADRASGGTWRRWRARRCAKMAISLPSVVGEAVCPCVRASMATSACCSASAATASITCASSLVCGSTLHSNIGQRRPFLA